MCGKKATVVTHSNQDIKIIAPACPNEGVAQVVLLFKDFNMQLSFTYEAPQPAEETISISQIVPESSSPQRSHIKITGDGFGTDASAVEV